MLLKHALAEYLLEIEIRKYTPKTIRSYRNNLNLFVRYLTEEGWQSSFGGRKIPSPWRGGKIANYLVVETAFTLATGTSHIIAQVISHLSGTFAFRTRVPLLS